MRVPVDKIASTFKMGATTVLESDAPVRISVFVDATATPFLIETVRDALVPQTTGALVRVDRLTLDQPSVKADTDIAIVLTSGSEHLQQAVQQVVIAGAPTVVLAESSVEVPFITEDTRMLGLIASTDKTHLLETLARWILDRTEKQTAFAANFPFMRIAAAMRVITSTALTNMATGALVFVPGADFPVMTLAQLSMMMELAAIFGKPVRLERGYEAAGIVVSGLALRALTRAVVKHTPHLGFAVKAIVAAAGTFAVGRALTALYEHDVDYAPANAFVGGVVSRARTVVAGFRAEGSADDAGACARAA